jgi:secreted protein with Ig-like and vWFA domain
MTVTFMKKDKTVRTINGRLNVKKYLRGGKATVDTDKFLVMYSVADQGYRAVNKDSILSIAVDGVIIQTRGA